MSAQRRLAAPRRRSFTLFVVFALAACVWWLLAPPIPEGATLVKFTPDHGIDVSDLAILPVLAVVAWLVWRRRRGTLSGGK